MVWSGLGARAPNPSPPKGPGPGRAGKVAVRLPGQLDLGSLGVGECGHVDTKPNYPS